MVRGALRKTSAAVLRHLALALFGLLLVSATSARIAAAQTQSPSQVRPEVASASTASEAERMVGALHNVLSANLRDGDALGFDARLARLAPVVAGSFDFQAIARVVMGREIKALDDEAISRIERLLGDLSAATYADRFSGSESSIIFVVVSERPARGGRTVLRTHLQEPGQEPVVLDYVLQKTANGLRIVNVIANGVSDLSLKRAEYAAVIRRRGVSSLVAQIENQLSQLTQSAAAGG